MFFLVAPVLFISSVIFLIIIYLLWYQNNSQFFLHIKKIPGPPSYPILGNVLEYYTNKETLFEVDRRLCRTYSPIYSEWSLNYAAVILLEPQDIEIILSSNKHIDKGHLYSFLHSWLGTGLLTSTGQKWHNRRKILTPAFHFTILQQFIEIFNTESGKLVIELEKKSQDHYINVVPLITQFTLQSIAETSMGIKLDANPQKNNFEYKKAIKTMGQILVYRIIRPWLFENHIFNITPTGAKARKVVKTLHQFSKTVIKERKQHFNYSTGKRLAMLDLLLSAQSEGADIDDEGIREEVDTFMFEGHDTTSVAICHVLMLLANNRKEQDEIYREITEILPNSTNPTYDDLKAMTYLERCLKECLRLYPSVPFIARTLNEDVQTKTGYTLPKNAMIHIHIYDLHRNPQLYPDPEKFDPDRFLLENLKERHPFAYIPFSAGPRNCIGQRFAMLELKSVVCAILKKFFLEPFDTPKDIKHITDLVLRCEAGIRVIFKPRFPNGNII